jgi:hypothetical protein
MPRTAKGGGRKKPPERPPVEEYSDLEWHKQFVCWNYFRYIESGGQEGWNPADAGSVFHYRSSEYVASLGTESWFRHLAKQMVTLAQKFASLNQIPPRPLGHTHKSIDKLIGWSKSSRPSSPSSTAASSTCCWYNAVSCWLAIFTGSSYPAATLACCCGQGGTLPSLLQLFESTNVLRNVEKLQLHQSCDNN